MRQTKLKILIISSGNFFSTYGGGQVYVKNLVDELIRQGSYPTIASPGKQSDGVQNYQGCNVFVFAPTAEQPQLEELLQTIKPDIVHAHGYKASFTKACNTIGIPCIITAHHGGILCPAGTLLNYRDQICHTIVSHDNCLPCVLKNIRWGMAAWPILRMVPLGIRLEIGRWLKKIPFIPYLTTVVQSALSIKNKAKEWDTICKKTWVLIAPSNAIAESMKINGAKKDKIVIVPHGIPLPKGRTPEKYINTKRTTSVRFFFVGRICHVKGVHTMLEAFQKVCDPAELHIIGGTGNKTEHRYMKALVKKYKSDLRITWHGKIAHNKVNELITHFDIMIHPSICLEVFGLNISEALAMGKPVIASRCGGAEMQIVDNVNGWLVKPNDIAALRHMIMLIVKEPHLTELTSKQIGPFRSLESHIIDLKRIYRDIYEKKTDSHGCKFSFPI